MKTRSGFVSNSSSSSFVVHRVDRWFSKRPKKVLTRQEETKLKKFGFVQEHAYYPNQVGFNGEQKPLTPEEKRTAAWVYSVVCNQYEPIQFLLKNRISFVADVHYEHFAMIYNGKTDELLIAQNFGKQSQMGYIQSEWKKIPPFEKTTGTKYLKDDRL